MWSAAASQSRDVKIAWFAAFYEARFIVPCILDLTPLPSCLRTTVFLDLSRSNPNNSERLISAVKGAPNAANPIFQAVLPTPATLARSLTPLLRLQQDISARWYRRDRAGMIALQRRLDKLTTQYCLFVVPDLNLAPLYAYHLMHTYILKHWEAIQDRHPRWIRCLMKQSNAP